MDDKTEIRCFVCQKTDREGDLQRCLNCQRPVCPDHAHAMSGRLFCSKPCASFYFFADQDDT